MTKVYKVKALPEETLITKDFPTIDFFDSYFINKKTDKSIDRIVKEILTLPAWIKFALRMRYRLIVKPFGLTTGRINSKAQNEEDKYELVPIMMRSDNEIVLGSEDKHLNYRISVLKDVDKNQIYLNTVVKYNNIGGKIYFAFVKLGHKMVVKALLSKL